MEPLTNDQLITLINGTFTLPSDLHNSLINELRSRLPNSPKKDAEDEKVYYQIKDLHERLDQVCKKLVELEEAKPFLKGTPITGFESISKAPELITEQGFFDTEHSPYAPDCKVHVPKGWHIFKQAREINWSDEDMLNFATIVFYRSPAEAKKLFEEYKNRPAKK